ncbi:hypothetical protein D3I89_31725, partial [Pseudomonas aeruginosa]
ANERKVSVSTHRQALAALLFFYGKVPGLVRLALAGEVQGGRLHVLPCADEIDLAWTQGSREWLALETFIDT